MTFIFMVFHYPEPAYRAKLVRDMVEMAAVMAAQPGFIEAGPWREEGSDRVIGISRWESREAFLATGIAIEDGGDAVEPGETRPRERFFLEIANPG